MPLVFRIGRGLLAMQLFGFVLMLPLAAFVAAIGVWLVFAEFGDLGTAGRLALALFMLACGAAIGGGALLTLQTFRAFRRLRLEIRTDRLEATLPRWSGITPHAPATTTYHPWRELAALEWREEIYRGFLMSAVYETWTLVTTAGERLKIARATRCRCRCRSRRSPPPCASGAFPPSTRRPSTAAACGARCSDAPRRRRSRSARRSSRASAGWCRW